MHGIKATSNLIGYGGEQVPVPIHGDLVRGVAKLSLDRLGVRSFGDEQGSTGMAEFVRSNVKARCLEGASPRPSAKVASAQGFAVRGSEDECILSDPNVGRQMLGQLLP